MLIIKELNHCFITTKQYIFIFIYKNLLKKLFRTPFLYVKKNFLTSDFNTSYQNYKKNDRLFKTVEIFI